jgi:ParB-like chromosome segregation protein Spo0J
MAAGPETPRIDPEFRALIPPLHPDELAGLREAIRREGCRDPITIWREEDVILDGHHRFDICQEFGIPYPISALSFAGREAAMLWMLEHQVHRRNLIDDQRVIIAKEIIERRKKIYMSERGKKGGRPRKDRSDKNLSVNATDKFTDSSAPKQDTRATVAAELKVSERDIRKARAIEKAVTEAKGKEAAQQVMDDIKAGKTTINQARRKARRTPRKAIGGPVATTTPTTIAREEVPDDADDPTADGLFDGKLSLTREAGYLIELDAGGEVFIRCRAEGRSTIKAEEDRPSVMIDVGCQAQATWMRLVEIELTIQSARSLIEKLGMAIGDANRMKRDR